MDLARHCDLCDNQIIRFEDGTVCGLTNRKPDFNSTCARIKLTDKFENKLKAVNIEYERVKRTKALALTYFIVFLTIGITIIVSGFLFGKFMFSKGVLATLPLIIMSTGLLPLSMAFGKLNYYLSGNRMAKAKKDQVDEVLKKYRIEYTIDIQFGMTFHDHQEAFAELKTKGIR